MPTIYKLQIWQSHKVKLKEKNENETDQICNLKM